ncbi:MAG: helix-hairpin-helix domain-containing protein [Chthonomonadales bacterium]
MSEETQSGSKAPLAMAVLLGLFAIAGGVRLIQSQSPPKSEMVIIPANGSSNSSAAPNPTPSSVANPTVSTAPPKPTEVVVHVAGSVKTPGVYHLPETARNNDAVKAAGGPKQEANLAGINLAAPVVDGSQLYIPSKAEHPDGGASRETVTSSTGKPGKKDHASSKSSRGSASSGGKGNKLTSPAEGKVNVNTAGSEQLQRLPGVGPAMAEKIIQHRKENGPFTSPDQLTEVSGIGPKKFEKMKPFVSVTGGKP